MIGTVAGSTPYAWPYDRCLGVERTALVVVGAGAWARFVPADARASANIESLRSAFAAVGALVVTVAIEPLAIRIDHRLLPAASPAPGLRVRRPEVAVSAAGIDGFYGSALDAVLQQAGCSHLVVCGLGLESAVHSTVRRANDRGYECLTVIDAAAAHDSALRHASRSSIEMSGGIFGAVAETAPTLAAYAAAEPPRPPSPPDPLLDPMHDPLHDALHDPTTRRLR